MRPAGRRRRDPSGPAGDLPLLRDMQNLDTSADEAPRVVLVTASAVDVALALARALVEKGLAACANVVPGVTSVYRWQGAVQEDAEVLLVVKTVRGRLEELAAFLAEHHPYDVPECVALAPTEVAADYLDWMRAQTGPAR